MRRTPTPGSVAGRRVDKAGDPLDGLINLFDLSLVLAVGLLLAALSSIGATGLIAPGGGAGTPLQGQPQTSGPSASGPGQEVGKVYRLQDGRFVFAPSTSSGSTSGTGTATPTPSTPTGATGSVAPTTSTPPPASTTPTPATPAPTGT
ncbi:MAG TPA: hypothetical protein VGO97_02580 [Solirubrobacterales bacterium]|jgi:hypothetical protein|nr:hypothetical protein [Solirubrobacterales bacterium]